MSEIEPSDWFGLIAVFAIAVVVVMFFWGCSPKSIVVKDEPEDVTCEEALQGAWDALNLCWDNSAQTQKDKENYRKSMIQCGQRLDECLWVNQEK